MISSVEYPKAPEHPFGARFQAAADSANIPASSCGAEFSSVARTLRKER
jgi:acetyl esterase/lipase